MDAGLVTPCAGSAAARKVWGLTLRPLPKTVSPHPDELLSSWLARLAAANYCDFVDLLAHIGIDSHHTIMLDFALETEAAERIAVIARTDVDRVQSLLFPVLTQTEAALTAQVPLHTCPNCSRQGLALKHWRRAWVVDCQVCGALLTPTLGKPDIGLLSDQLLRRARKGAALLGSAVTLNSVSQIRRAMRGVAFAMALKNARGTPAAALQSYNPEVRLFCLAAIAAVQKRPLLKAALFTTGIDAFARVALLRTYHREARLLATVDRIACRIQHRVRTLRSRSSEQS
jgi:hypothetical protein